MKNIKNKITSDLELLIVEFNKSKNYLNLYKEMCTYGDLNEMTFSRELILDSLILNAVVSIFIVMDEDPRSITLNNIIKDIELNSTFNTEIINKLKIIYLNIKSYEFKDLEFWRNKWLVHKDHIEASDLCNHVLTTYQIEHIQYNIQLLLDELVNLLNININELYLQSNDFSKFANKVNLK